jgi:O-succinylbenzoate synthase
MRVFVHRYQLVPRRALSPLAGAKPREGALLRVDGGYADLHPWPELGDAPLDEQLTRLARGEPTAQVRASLRFAALDADARTRGVSLFEGLAIPESHWPGDDPPPAFDTIKIKDAPLWGRPPAGRAAGRRPARVRIDFNARLSADEFARIAETLPKEQIDFIEDPCPYDERVWRELRERTGLRLALDRFEGKADVLIHKPALGAKFPKHDDVVVTSYMDHPIGQFGAAYVAATHDVNPRCGLFTHVLYEPDAFLERIESDGARLLPPRGTGIGFDDLLETLSWTSIG